MAVKAVDQTTLYDITDGFNVLLSSDAIALTATATNKLGTAVTRSIDIICLKGTEEVEASVTAASVVCPTNVSVTSVTTSGNTITVTLSFAANLASAGVVKIPVQAGDVTITKDLSFSLAFKGATGAANLSVIVGNESQMIYCDKDGNVDGEQTITIPFAGYSGSSRAACTMADPTLPTGFTKVSNTAATASANGAYVCKVANGTALAETGTITLTLTVSSTTFTKSFTYARAQVGATGAQGPQGPDGTSATSVACGNEAVTIACDKDGKTAAAGTIVIPFAGYVGTARAACTVAYSSLPSGITLATNGNVPATASADGSLTFNIAAGANLGANATMTGEITLTFTCNSQQFVKKFTWSKSLTGATGAQGDAGEDAITLVILSSNGTIFRNNDVETTLTAHVYKAGAEVTGAALTALGAINWYKDGGSTAVATGSSITLDADDVQTKAVYEARLEA